MLVILEEWFLSVIPTEHSDRLPLFVILRPALWPKDLGVGSGSLNCEILHFVQDDSLFVIPTGRSDRLPLFVILRPVSRPKDLLLI